MQFGNVGVWLGRSFNSDWFVRVRFHEPTKGYAPTSGVGAGKERMNSFVRIVEYWEGLSVLLRMIPQMRFVVVILLEFVLGKLIDNDSDDEKDKERYNRKLVRIVSLMSGPQHFTLLGDG